MNSKVLFSNWKANTMTKQELIQRLEHATLYGTWEQACEAQRQLDAFCAA